jgi:hypothetical protein
VEAVVRFFGVSVEQDKRRGDPPSLGYGVTGGERGAGSQESGDRGQG